MSVELLQVYTKPEEAHELLPPESVYLAVECLKSSSVIGFQ